MTLPGLPPFPHQNRVHKKKKATPERERERELFTKEEKEKRIIGQEDGWELRNKQMGLPFYDYPCSFLYYNTSWRWYVHYFLCSTYINFISLFFSFNLFEFLHCFWIMLRGVFFLYSRSANYIGYSYLVNLLSDVGDLGFFICFYVFDT